MAEERTDRSKGNDRNNRRDRKGGRDRKDFKEKSEFEERVVHISRNSKVVKGGRRFSFGALVVIGDRKGRVGYGLGKAGEVAEAIRKAGEVAKRNLQTVTMRGTTLPHAAIVPFRLAGGNREPLPPVTGQVRGD